MAKGTLSSTPPTPTPTVMPTPSSTPTPTPTPNTSKTNVALATNGGVASASSQQSGGAPGIAIDGVKNWATSGAWKDATANIYPDILQVDFNGGKTINEIDVFAVKDDFSNPVDPTEVETFNYYGITSFDVQYWNNSSWTTVPNGSVVGNNKVVTKLVFSPITTTKIRVVVNNAQAGYSRIVELQAWTDTTVTSTPTPTPIPTPTSTPTPMPTPVNTPTPSPTPTSGKTNVALTSNGGIASASTQSNGGAAGIAIDGIKNWATSGAWKDATPNSYPDWLQVDFNGSQTINEIDVYGVKDDYSNPVDPTESETFNYYGLTGFDVQYWNGSGWMTVANGGVINNSKVITKIVFPAVTTTKVRVVVNNAQANYSRIVELEAWTFTGSVTPTPTPSSTPTPTPTPGVNINVALATNGGVASASSQQSGGAPGIAIDGVKNWATSGAWKDATPDSYPDILQVDFSGSKIINEIDVYAVKDDYSNPADPTESSTFSFYGITNFDVQYWNNSSWVTVPNGNIVNNNKVITKLVFPAVTTTKIRVVVNNAQANYSRIVELQAWSSFSNYETQTSALNLHDIRDKIENFIGAKSSIFLFLSCKDYQFCVSGESDLDKFR
ncbi:MAG: discoidin domain-containing protein [Acidobacteria bacterium]|nr:discoidin domain-containing protein [Acidobacteriota bacterium]